MWWGALFFLIINTTITTTMTTRCSFFSGDCLILKIYIMSYKKEKDAYLAFLEDAKKEYGIILKDPKNPKPKKAKGKKSKPKK